jgi:predicted O-methyltransferase YrrM
VQSIRSTLSRALRNEWLGALDYWRFPDARESWGGSFNGQIKRREIFAEIVRGLNPVAIVETGTFRGTTTIYLAKTGLPIYTIEQDPRLYGFARMQLRGSDNITMLKQESRAALRALLTGPLRAVLESPIFFYLDAHWNDDLPLLGEVETILAAANRAVIMIDDFQVPGDEGYEFDDYGPSAVLNREYIEPVLRGRGVAVLYPAADSSEESGARRGCVILCGCQDAEILAASGLVREIN